MNKKTPSKKKTSKTSKKKPASSSKKSPAKKKPASGSKKSPAKKKPASGSKKSPATGGGHRAVEKKHHPVNRPRILPADTPFPLKFSAKSNRAIEKYVYNKKSTIHGMGAFAKNRIPGKAYVGSYEGIPSLDDDIYVLWVEQDNGTWRGIDGKNELRYLNHSSRPNCEWDANHLFAIRDIEPHEELTFHYGDEWDDVE
ncbi:MAG: SET domain-containing protein-lysine N-methyltransferase [Leptospiraceae bacterium]|nr:SET domain-containing protein-lysine N-methyltransferase [Leptospiraceae bacterium]